MPPSESPASTATQAAPLPLIAMIAVVVLWGAGPVVTKLVTVDPFLGACLRFAISIPVLFGLLRLRSRRLSRQVVTNAALPGLAFGINLIFVFAAVQEVAVAVLAVVVALQPAVLLVVGGRLLGERPTPAQIAWTLIGVTATAGVILGAADNLRASPLGLVLSLLALAAFVIYFALTRRARASINVDPVEWMTAINLWSLLATLIPALFVVDRNDIVEIDGSDVVWLLVLAWATGITGHVLMSWVHGYIEASRSALYLLGMNIVAIGLAWPVHDEPVNLTQILCGIVVLVAVASVIRLPTDDRSADGGGRPGGGADFEAAPAKN